MAVTQVTTNTTQDPAASSFSGNVTISASSNWFVVDIGYNSVTGLSITSVTYGGVSMTKLGTTAASGTPQFAYAESWGLASPPTGTNLLVITGAGGTFTDLYFNSEGYSGVNLTSPVRTGTYQTTTGTGITASQTISSSTNDLTHTCINSGGPAFGATPTNQTVDNTPSTAGAYAFGQDRCTTPAASVTHTWTFANTPSAYAMVGYSINGDPSGNPATPPSAPLWVVGKLGPLMSMVLRALHVGQTFASTSPVASSPDGPVNYEALDGAGPVASSGVAYEALGSVAQTQQAFYEALASLLQTQQVAYEALAGLSQSQQVFYEELATITQSLQIAYEALASVAQTQQVADESLGSVSQTQQVFYEALGGIAQTQQVFYEALGGIAQAQQLAYEALGQTVVLQTQQVAYEALAGITTSQDGYYESLASLLQTAQVVYESLGSLASAILVAYEALAGVAQSQTVGYEAAGQLVVAQSQTVAYEALQQLLVSQLVGEEVLAALNQLQQAGTESLGSLSVSSPAALETLAQLLQAATSALESAGPALVILARIQRGQGYFTRTDRNVDTGLGPASAVTGGRTVTRSGGAQVTSTTTNTDRETRP